MHSLASQNLTLFPYLQAKLTTEAKSLPLSEGQFICVQRATGNCDRTFPDLEAGELR